MRKERSLIADEQYEVNSTKAERGQVTAGEKSEDSREAGSYDLRKDVVSINKSTKWSSKWWCRNASRHPKVSWDHEWWWLHATDSQFGRNSLLLEDDATLDPRSYRGEISAGYGASKDRLSLWSGANAAGDEGEASAQWLFGNSQGPEEWAKSTLPVLSTWNHQAWMTEHICLQYRLPYYFKPTVETLLLTTKDSFYNVTAQC